MDAHKKSLLLPFTLTAAIITLDQITKALVDAYIACNSIGWTALGDFFWLVHQRNPGAAFSVGDTLPPALRIVIMIILPALLMAALLVFYIKSKDLTRLQRWSLCGIIGGGIGNIIDRILRPDGVVDFLSFKFYGLLGLERWPSFNVADASVVVCCFLLIISGFFLSRPETKDIAPKT